MKKSRASIVLLLGLFLSTLSFASFASEYIIKLKPEKFDDFSSAILATQSQHSFVKVLDSHKQGSLVKIDLGAKTPLIRALRIRELQENSSVEYIVPNILFHAVTTPNDPNYTDQWSHQMAQSEAAWDTHTGSKNVVVAVIDTGIDTNHEDLRDNIWVNPNEIAGNGVDDDGNGYVDDINGWDFRANDNNPDDETSDKNPGHGTHCAGIVGAVGNNGTGVTGMSWDVSLMAVRFLGSDGSGDLMSAAKAIDYAVNNGAHIISASWGAAVAASGAKPIIDAIGRAHDKGVIFVAAAANDGKNNDVREVFPANTDFPNMISVAASQADDTKPDWSNYGFNKVHVASPGHEILSTIPGNQYRKFSGTSMATPMVAGLAAMLLAANNMDPIDGLTMRSYLQSTGASVNIETACECRIDAKAALDAVTGQNMLVVPNALTVAPNGTANFTAHNGKAPFQYKSSDQAVATIDGSGMLTAKTLGETTITITDADGTFAQSKKIRIADAPDGGNDQCPFDEATCIALCMIDNTLPWCD